MSGVLRVVIDAFVASGDLMLDREVGLAGAQVIIVGVDGARIGGSRDGFERTK